jgi:hypothetical protein
VGRMQRRLGKLEGMSRAVVPSQLGRDLACLDDDELDELAGLARKAEVALPSGWKSPRPTACPLESLPMVGLLAA